LINTAAEADMPPRTLKVLFAEDEVLLRLMVTDVLRQNDFQVLEARDAAEAISILRTTPVDVVITDLHMRGVGDGMEVASHVRAHCPGASLLLATANPPAITPEHSPFDAFFIKPYEPVDIVMWIRRHHATANCHEDSRLA
jgi:two-component system, response regulator PdtaR